MATLSGVPVVWLSPRPVLRSTEDSDTLEVSPRSPGWVMVLYVPHSLESDIPLKLIVSRRGDGSPESELSVLPMTEREVSVVIPRDRLPAGDYWLDLYQGDERLAEYSLSITTVAKPE